MSFKLLTSSIQEASPFSSTDTQREEYFDVLDSILAPKYANEIYHDDRD